MLQTLGASLLRNAVLESFRGWLTKAREFVQVGPMAVSREGSRAASPRALIML